MTNEPTFSSLGLRCCGGHKHVQLKGTEKVYQDGAWINRNRTKGAGAYPPRLCRQWAQVTRQICPVNSKRRFNGSERSEFDKLLREAMRAIQRQDAETADGPDHPSWEDQARGDPKLLQEASDYINKHAVVFGQFTKSDIEKEHRKEHSE